MHNIPMSKYNEAPLMLMEEPKVPLNQENRTINNILIIDDDELYLMSLEVELQHRNYTVYCSNGKDTLDSYLDKNIDFILCDIHMDIKSGFELLEEIHVNNRFSMIPVVLMSGLVDAHVIRRAMWLGADDILEKPFSIDDLVNVIVAQSEKRERIQKYAEQRLDTLRESIHRVFPSELFNPLHIIAGNSYILSELTDEVDQRKMKKIGQSISKGASQLQAIFENISTYTHLLTHKNIVTNLSKEKFIYDAGLVIENTCRHIAQKYLRDHCLKIQNNFTAQVCISREYLEKIIEIVVDNAFKFSPLDSSVMVDVKEESPVLRITVQDFGDGINENQLSLIGPFMQFEKEKYQQRGIGLGLSLAKLIVELHSGIITFHSVKGEGTTVSIIIPLLSEQDKKRSTQFT
jgi:two-component system sensor histidine kinase/response regulator